MQDDHPISAPRRRGPKPSGRRARTIGVRLYPDEIEALRNLLADQDQPASLSGLAASLIVEGLERNGLNPK